MSSTLSRVDGSAAGESGGILGTLTDYYELSKPRIIMLLGVVSLRAGTKLHYDGETMRVTNNAAANDYLTRQYREGWKLV